MFTFCEKWEKPTAEKREKEGIEALGKINCLIYLLKSLTHIQLLVNNNTIKNSKYGILYFVKLHA